MQRTSLFVVLALTGTLAFAQKDHATMNHAAPAATAKGVDLSRLNGRAFDRAFLSMMIPHHEAAVEMSEAVLPAAKDPRVKAWATAIIREQKREIDEMTALLKNYGGVDTRARAAMAGMMNGMDDEVRSATDKQRAFVSGMVGHHGDALDMANLALQKASGPAVLKLARDIARAQAQEMYDFRRYLRP